MTAINEFIDNEVKSNDVVLFMKGTPQFPQCGFSGQVVQILDYLGVPYKGINVLADDDLRQIRISTDKVTKRGEHISEVEMGEDISVDDITDPSRPHLLDDK